MKPRPSRKKLDDAEARLDTARRDHDTARAAIDRHMERLRTDREALDEAFRRQREALKGKLDEVERDYKVALVEWRGGD